MSRAADDAHLALGLARELSYPAGEALALTELGLVAHYTGEYDVLLSRAREACLIDSEIIPGAIVRRRDYVLTIALTRAGRAAAAYQSCAAGLARAREVGDVQSEAAFLDAMIRQEVQLAGWTEPGNICAKQSRLPVRPVTGHGLSTVSRKPVYFAPQRIGGPKP